MTSTPTAALDADLRTMRSCAVTGHHPGWVPVGDGAEDRWFREGLASFGAEEDDHIPDDTYELCGPKVQGNPEGYERHVLIPHGLETLPDAPRTFDALRDYLATANIEGIVWHHPDGRMVKIKGKDFGLHRAPTPRTPTV